METFKTAKRTALVTGAAGGMGVVITRALVAEGYAVVGTDRHRLEGGGETVAWYDCDLADRAATEAMAARVIADGRAIDALINCAGINQQKPDGGRNSTEEVTNAIWDLTIAVNLTAPFVLCRAFVPGMKARRWGRIVNISSRAGRTFSPPSNVDYSASKAGLIGLTRMVAGECSSAGVTVNVIAPGRIATPLEQMQSEEIKARAMLAIPAGRVGTVDEIAGTVRFLASDAAGYITGATIDVNGGAYM
jgi:3-oxoacyl-[acyl-carrier protein] reductase